MLSRRTALRRIASLPLIGGGLAGATAGTAGASDNLAGVPAAGSAARAAAEAPFRDYFQELGLRSFINAAGTYTSLTGSLMPDEVVRAIEYARRRYVVLDDIQDRVGERIAELLRCEAATVTSGAFSGMTLGVAGAMCGMDQEKVEQLPDTTGLKNEVVMLKPPHPVGYVHALTNAGAKIVEVESREQLEGAINEHTAMLFIFNAYNGTPVSHEELVAVGKKHGIPTFNDAAADVPPVENLWKYTDMGFDLVAFSGGKGLRGPQSAGLLLGRKDLIAAARMHAPPRGSTIGRGMKVNKEEVLGMLVALERYLETDHDAEWKMWEAQIEHIDAAVRSVPGTTTEVNVPEIANHTPTLHIAWDGGRIGLTPPEVKDLLRDGHPSIEVAGGSDDVSITVWMMQSGEERVVASRLHQILLEASI